MLDATGERPARRIVAVPADEDAIVGLLGRRDDHVEHDVAFLRDRAVLEATGSRRPQRGVECRRARPRDRRIALVGGTIGIALEHVQDARADRLREREHLVGRRRAA